MRTRRPTRLLACCASLTLILTACSDSGGGGEGGGGSPAGGTGGEVDGGVAGNGGNGGNGGVGNSGGTGNTGGTDPDAVGDDVPDKDLYAAPETAPEPGEFGASCEENAECDGGWCVEGPDGFLCSQTCSDSCPPGWDCKVVQGTGTDAVSLCIPRLRKLCVECEEDGACNGGVCLEIDGDLNCTYECVSDDDCIGGYTCGEDPAGVREGTFCLPVTASCTCREDFDPGQRVCTRSNALGECLGTQTCDPLTGWSECSASEPVEEQCNGIDDDCNKLIDDGLEDGAACENIVEGVGSCPGVNACFGPAGWNCQGPEPSEEICDFKDNNCDGEVDEGFANADGVYDSFEHCGTCNNSCGLGFPNALETTCQVTGGVAQCVVVVCAPGFEKVNEFQCVPTASSLCQPCAEDANCLGDGAACVSLSDGTYCGQPCESPEECPLGYVCSNVGAASSQCVPESNSCSCDGTNTDLSRACSVTYTPDDPNQPAYTCKGLEQCTEDGWGPCVLPPEECDGVDNDCNGEVDEDFKDGTGVYASVDHCGGCGISCLALGFDNADPSCDTSGPVPQCAFTCQENWFDVNGIVDDGCECQPVPGPDFAGDNLDTNCDGIDGDIALGVFVAKNGDDGNPGTIDMPLLTIGAGLQRAFDTGKRDVYVATGVYSESIILRKGIGVFGGYSSDFFDRDTILFETAIIGQEPTAQKPAAVTGVNVGAAGDPQPTILNGFTIFGPNAANIAGENSYALYIASSGSQLIIEANRIFGSAGGNGDQGLPGDAGPSGANGSPGQDAYDLGTYAGNGNRTCNNGQHIEGGPGGSLVCPDGTNVSGGGGGVGDCPTYDSAPTAISDGDGGLGPAGGDGGEGGWDKFIDATQENPITFNCALCNVPPDNNPGQPGLGGAGADGAWGMSGGGCSNPEGSIVAGHWVGGVGSTGGKGGHGSGGGGGGAGGGVEVDGNMCKTNDPANGAFNAAGHDISGSGGGGGSGGCAGTGGTGGIAGGGSFGIFIVYTSAPSSVPQLIGNFIQRGSGGTGGSGGSGGNGGVGGSGAAGGESGEEQSITFCTEPGGKGGEGGLGGHGGGGGGGCGGASYGIYVYQAGGSQDLSAYTSNNTFASGGQGGSPGPGGPSAGNAGSSGANGASADTNF